MHNLYRLLLVPGAFCGATAVWAQSATPEAFIVGQSDGMTEVKLHPLPKQNTQSEDGLSLLSKCRRIMDKANSELQSIATSKHMDGPRESRCRTPGVGQGTEREKKGADFDCRLRQPHRWRLTRRRWPVQVSRSFTGQGYFRLCAKTLPTLSTTRVWLMTWREAQMAAGGHPGANQLAAMLCGRSLNAPPTSYTGASYDRSGH